MKSAGEKKGDEEKPGEPEEMKSASEKKGDDEKLGEPEGGVCAAHHDFV